MSTCDLSNYPLFFSFTFLVVQYNYRNRIVLVSAYGLIASAVWHCNSSVNHSSKKVSFLSSFDSVSAMAIKGCVILFFSTFKTNEKYLHFTDETEPFSFHSIFVKLVH